MKKALLFVLGLVALACGYLVITRPMEQQQEEESPLCI
jgi:hypothetical protein